ncbi:hypothetical protein SteCoe_2029 [Stentor coeruleus]|uniref:Uncharacterized protein n=1 Tax=Stentor coeruleus TaxID=5963 RepID=A0A1R2D0D3_9CILI|nr:hypothetical protein SteCoe_2029 [Stentor coeruleus]
MALNRLLIKIPKNINVPHVSQIREDARSHTVIVNSIGFLVLGWFATIIIANFPVTFGPKRVESRAFPDYASGQVFTEFRTVDRSFSFI